MSKHEELIERLRIEPTASQFLNLSDLFAAMTQERKQAADALEAQAREIEGLRNDAKETRPTAGGQKPIAYVDGDEAVRRILWEPNQAAFDMPVGTKLYACPDPTDAVDAERYRWLRRWKGQEHEPPFTVQHEIDGTLWGGDLDAAIDAAKGTPHG